MTYIGHDWKPARYRVSSWQWLTWKRALGIVVAYFLLHVVAITLTLWGPK